ncbi:hypothetical protein BVRB_6g131070 [Beta vulgaris subsp. vulgaris]|nr:hypothetical protein BVRB_6g131070 [Beta vulgaris subsp. vulgaris]
MPDHVVIRLECLGDNINRDGWLSPERSISNGNNTWVLAAQSSNRDSRNFTIIIWK